MLFHMSIAAREPRHVAEVFAELWGGRVFAFRPVCEDGWIAIAGDDRGTAIEVYPEDIVLRETEGDFDAHGERMAAPSYTPTHAAIATEMTLEQVLALAEREGWPAKYRKRGGMFGVIELWIEGRLMMEVLTPPMQAEYLAAMGAREPAHA
jgi:hypothetical protein